MTVSAIAYKARWSLYTYALDDALDGSGKDIYLSQLDKVVRYASFEQLYSTLDKKNALNQHSFIVMLGWDDKQYTQFFAAHQEIQKYESLFSQDITAFVLNDEDPLSKINMLLECINGMLSGNTAWDAQTEQTDIETFINTYKTQQNQQESVWTDTELDGNDKASSQDGISDTTPTHEPVEGLQGNGSEGSSLQQDAVQYQYEEELDSNEQLSTTSSVSSDDLENGSGGFIGFFVNKFGRMLIPSQDQDPDQGNDYTQHTP